MGIFSRMRRAVKAKANAAIDKAIDPEREIEMVIMELEEQRKKALQELVDYKTTAKQMEQDLERQEKKAAAWEQRAVAAVKAGDDELAKKALREKHLCESEAAKIRADRDEAAGYALELNRSRKAFDTKLRMLKLKKGTLATQLAASRSGGGSALGGDELFERFERAGDKIDEEAIAAEVHAALEGEELAAADFDQQLIAAGGDPQAATSSDGGDPLAALKARMEADRRKRLGAGRASAEDDESKT
jgi:phage shock protein A